MENRKGSPCCASFPMSRKYTKEHFKSLWVLYLLIGNSKKNKEATFCRHDDCVWQTFGMAYQGNLKAVLLILTLTDTNTKHPVHHNPCRCWCITWTHARSFPLGLEPANESWRRPAGACPSAWWRWGRLSSGERWTQGPEEHGMDTRHFPAWSVLWTWRYCQKCSSYPKEKVSSRCHPYLDTAPNSCQQGRQGLVFLVLQLPAGMSASPYNVNKTEF